MVQTANILNSNIFPHITSEQLNFENSKKLFKKHQIYTY